MSAQVVIASRLVALLAIGLVPTAVAHADTQDDRYLAALSAIDITGDPDWLIAAGHFACDNYGSPAVIDQMNGLMALGYSGVQASNVVVLGIRAYCPEKTPFGPLT